MAFPLHGLRERWWSLPDPLHGGPLVRGPPPLLHGAGPGPVQQRRVCQRLGYGPCTGRGGLWSGIVSRQTIKKIAKIPSSLNSLSFLEFLPVSRY